MAKGYGIQTSDWLIIGIFGISAYVVWKYFLGPVSKVTNAAGDVIAGAENAVGGVFSGVGNAASSAISAAKSLLTGKNQTITGTPISPFDSPSKTYIPSDASLKAIGYGNGQPSVQTNVANWNDLIPSSTTATASKTTNTTTATPTKSLTTAKTGTLLSSSTGDASGKVTVTTAGGRVSSYQVNMGSGTGSSSATKTLSPGVTNIKAQISTAQKTGTPVNLISLGKGAIINLDTGDVRYK